MTWLVTIGSQKEDAPQLRPPRYETVEVAQHPANYVIELNAADEAEMDALREKNVFGRCRTTYWVVFAMPVEPQPTLLYYLNVIAEVIRSVNRNFQMCNPTLPQWTGYFARVLQDTIGKVKVEVAE